jgi:hypothetical protein
MWPISRRYEVSDDTIDWLRESFDWAIEKGLLTAKTPLVRMTKEFFTAPSSKSPDFALCLVRDIQRIIGIETADIAVIPLERLDRRFQHDYQSLGSTAGTWQGDGESALIRYDLDLIDRPINLIATLTHEVMHNILRGMSELPPGGEEAEELSTDLHCITTGFGLFQMAGAEDIGWSGYMRQPSRAHAMAMFLRMRGIPEREALQHLPQRCFGYLKASLAWVDRNDPKIARCLADEP